MVVLLFLGGRAALRAKLTFVVHSVLAVGRKSELAAVAGVVLVVLSREQKQTCVSRRSSERKLFWLVPM